MKYVSCDIETTGLDESRCQILQIGAVVEDTKNILPIDELPTFNCVVIHEELTGSPFALRMNAKLIALIAQWLDADEATRKEVSKASGLDFFIPHEVAEQFHYFLQANGINEGLAIPELNQNVHRINYKGKEVIAVGTKTRPIKLTVAGKNFGTFDKKFLESQIPRWNSLVRFKQRIIDPTTLFTDFLNDEELPGLSECKKRAKLPEQVSHDAVEGSKDVVMLLRNKYVKR